MSGKILLFAKFQMFHTKHPFLPSSRPARRQHRHSIHTEPRGARQDSETLDQEVRHVIRKEGGSELVSAGKKKYRQSERAAGEEREGGVTSDDRIDEEIDR